MPGAPSAPVPPATLAQFHAYVRFASIDPARNRAHVYTLAWQPLLWGGGAVVCTWGRLGRPGRTRKWCYPDRASAQATVERIIRRRLQHGYQVVSWH